MFFFAVFAFVAALAFALYARQLSDAGQLPRLVIWRGRTPFSGG